MSGARAQAILKGPMFHEMWRRQTLAQEKRASKL